MDQDQILSAGHVARLFGVAPKTVTRWAKSGLLQGFRTPGGHYRFRESEVRRFIEDGAGS